MGRGGEANDSEIFERRSSVESARHSAIRGLDAVIERLGLTWTAADERAVVTVAPEVSPVIDPEDEWLASDPLPSRDPRVKAAIALLAQRCWERGDAYVSELTDELVVFPARGRKLPWSKSSSSERVVTIEDWLAFLTIWSRLPVRTPVDFAGWWRRRLSNRLTPPSSQRRRSGGGGSATIDRDTAQAMFSGAVGP